MVIVVDVHFTLSDGVEWMIWCAVIYESYGRYFKGWSTCGPLLFHHRYEWVMVKPNCAHLVGSILNSRAFSLNIWNEFYISRIWYKVIFEISLPRTDSHKTSTPSTSLPALYHYLFGNVKVNLYCTLVGGSWMFSSQKKTSLRFFSSCRIFWSSAVT